MSRLIQLHPLDKAGIKWAQGQVTRYHYLRKPVDQRCSVEGYAVHLPTVAGPVGLFLLGRPEATRKRGWYGPLAAVQAGRYPYTNWQVLNLARVWFTPQVQAGGRYCTPAHVPGFTDRRGCWRSTLPSVAIQQLIERVGFDYLQARPPVCLEEPYQIEWLLSYCDTRVHRGALYAAAGFERVPMGADHAGRPVWVNAQGIATWRYRLPPLTPAQHARIASHSTWDTRARQHRARRVAQGAQRSFLALAEVVHP